MRYQIQGYNAINIKKTGINFPVVYSFMTKMISLQSSIEICVSKCSEKNNKRYILKCEIFYFNPSLLKQYRQESKSNKPALLLGSSKIQRKISSLGLSMLSLMNKDKKFARLIQLLFANIKTKLITDDS